MKGGAGEGPQRAFRMLQTAAQASTESFSLSDSCAEHENERKHGISHNDKRSAFAVCARIPLITKQHLALLEPTMGIIILLRREELSKPIYYHLTSQQQCARHVHRIPSNSSSITNTIDHFEFESHHFLNDVEDLLVTKTVV